MSPPSQYSRRKQNVSTLLPTSVTANLAAETIDHHNENDSVQQELHKRRDTERKRCVKLCIVIAILCALWLQGVQTLQIIKETSTQETHAQDVRNISNGTVLPENNNNGEMIDDMPSITQRKIRFIPYPHRTLGSGASLQCQWETRHSHTNATTTSLLDFTQLNAYTEGVCIPPTLSDTLHIFSSEEAIQCLSSEVQNRDIRVILSGDSYMKQLYIGLADILLSKHITDDKQMKDKFQRAKVLSTAQYWMKKRREKNATFPFVQYQCEEECYGRMTMDVCSECITAFSGNDTRGDDVWVIGVGIHTYHRLFNQVDKAVQHIQHFLETEAQHNRTIYVSPPHYFHREDYPEQSSSMDHMYRSLLPHVAPENPAHPFLDVYELTKSCTMENCTFDGGHRSRYVNRWKAQLLLNTLCEVHYRGR